MPLIKKVSIKDIAEAAGVSTTLVSFVLNGKAEEYRINADTAKRIMDTAESMRYRPNIVAQSLRGGRSRVVGIVLPDISNPFFSSLARLFEDMSANFGYTVFFGSSDERPDRMRKTVGNLINRGVDGLIVAPCEDTESYLVNVAKNDVPLVLIDRYFPDTDISYVGLNNYKATYDATNYLLRSGYQRPAFIAYDLNLIHMKERTRGYCESMKNAGKESVSKVFYLQQKVVVDQADELMKRVLSAGFDSLMFATNLISLSCLYAIRTLNENETSKIGLVGFDGNPVFDFYERPIAYVKQPMDQLVKYTLEALMDKINGKEAPSMLIDGKLAVTGGKGLPHAEDVIT
ncbi:LacI family DNA-binding transcriptional regulator [Hoylesella buccalis]|uniref:LacI family DNA-binding transcriptional regulator n=1 Tax=Hoylesella buccalis TaxID=28127 RepID=UPI00236C95A8|nr:LacI family DNA-binding transcriptional regulator [Hoylesella buccalis]